MAHQVVSEVEEGPRCEHRQSVNAKVKVEERYYVVVSSRLVLQRKELHAFPPPPPTFCI